MVLQCYFKSFVAFYEPAGISTIVHALPVCLAAILDNVRVESYGSMSPLSSVAQASMKGPQLIVLTVFDPAVSIIATGVKRCYTTPGF